MADFSGLGFDSTLKLPIIPKTGDFIDIPGLKIGGSAITSSVAELNILDGVTATAAELNLLDGVTSTTAELNHLDGSSANLATFVLPASTTISSYGASLIDDANASAARTTLGLVIGTDVQAYDADLDNLSGMQSGASAALALLTSTEIAILDGATVSTAELNILDGVTSNASELNLVDGSSAGTIVNSKAAIYGSSGELNATTLQIAGVSISATAAEINVLDGITATTAELNILDGVTSTAAELNILDGVTATTAELNILDGVTSTAAELNILDGVTASTAEINKLDGVTATTAELNYVDVSTVGRGEGNKALVLDSNKDIRDIRNLIIDGDLTVGGTTTTINSTTVTIDDPIFTLGGDTAPSSDDNKDRGIEFRYHDGSAAKVGFFGMDDTDGRFKFIADATNSLEVFSGSVSDAEFRAVYVNSGGLVINSAQVTATAAELNILDGVTATTAELNILDGVTATAAELNILDGVTSTTAELNILDGVTATAAEINRLDITTEGLSEASKVVTADSSGVVEFQGDVNIGNGTAGKNLTIQAQSAIAFNSIKFAAGNGSAANVNSTRLLAITGEEEVSHASSANGSTAFNVVGVALEDGPTAASAAAKSASYLTGHPQVIEFDSGDAPSASGDNGKPVYLGTAGKAVMTAPSASGTKVIQVGFLLKHTPEFGNAFSVLFQPQFITANA